MYRIQIENIPVGEGEFVSDHLWYGRIPVAGDFITSNYGEFKIARVSLLAYETDAILSRSTDEVLAVCQVCSEG